MKMSVKIFLLVPILTTLALSSCKKGKNTATPPAKSNASNAKTLNFLADSVGTWQSDCLISENLRIKLSSIKVSIIITPTSITIQNNNYYDVKCKEKTSTLAQKIDIIKSQEMPGKELLFDLYLEGAIKTFYDKTFLDAYNQINDTTEVIEKPILISDKDEDLDEYGGRKKLYGRIIKGKDSQILWSNPSPSKEIRDIASFDLVLQKIKN